MRTLRIRDENAISAQLPGGKTIHQRNKSTPALSTLVNVGGLKAAAKRTVFADVSNTVRQPMIKDDMQVPSKGKQLEVLKDIAIVPAKDFIKPAALLRPAQRPLANNSGKSNAYDGTNSVASAVPRHVASDANLATTNIRKVLSKKATTIFKETHSDPIAEVSTSAPAPTLARQPSAPSTKSNHISEQAPVASELESKVEPKADAPALFKVRRSTFRPPLDAVFPIEPKEQFIEEEVTTAEPETKYPGIQLEVQEKYEYLDALEEQARVIEQERNEELAKVQALTRLEQEEYWDEEEEEEYFDADGYTTARSLRSRGDNTTGGVTLVLAPRVTAKSQRELEAAKLYVEAHKSPEDIEDEQWDTSMVAEYGEEIFEYMHSLEVSITGPY